MHASLTRHRGFVSHRHALANMIRAAPRRSGSPSGNALQRTLLRDGSVRRVSDPAFRRARLDVLLFAFFFIIL